MRATFFRCRVISAGVDESVTLATASWTSFQKTLVLTERRPSGRRASAPASTPPMRSARSASLARVRTLPFTVADDPDSVTVH